VAADGTFSDSDDVSGGERSLGRGLGPALRRAWVGYQLRLDAAMADAGFTDRRFPDGRVLRLCSEPAGSTISAIGRELGITRQGAGKVVGHLLESGYVSVADSVTSGREKSVTLTSQGTEYLQAQREATRAIDMQLRVELGEAGYSSLSRLLVALGQPEQIRLRTYLQRSTSAQAESSDDTSSGPSALVDSSRRIRDR
jgi:DNA-binding MarR family transcriptional regulator